MLLVCVCYYQPPIHPSRYIVFECIVALGGVGSGTMR